jgi:hypothetical protein
VHTGSGDAPQRLPVGALEQARRGDRAEIPKPRRGSYFPRFLEQARLNVVQQASDRGVSTRRVDQLLESLGVRISHSGVSRIARRGSMRRSRCSEPPAKAPLPVTPAVQQDPTFPPEPTWRYLTDEAYGGCVGVDLLLDWKEHAPAPRCDLRTLCRMPLRAPF